MRGNSLFPPIKWNPASRRSQQTDCPRLYKNKLYDLQKMKSSTRAISRLRKNVDVAIPQAPA